MRTRAIRECLRGVITTKCYTNPPLPLPLLIILLSSLLSFLWLLVVNQSINQFISRHSTEPQCGYAESKRNVLRQILNVLMDGVWYCIHVRCTVGDFETNGTRYELHELVYTLRAFGQLNYVPPNSGAFFGAVERILMSKFPEFDATSILELLLSFVYVERFPLNFVGHIFSPHVLVQIKGLCFVSSFFCCPGLSHERE